jgi:multisubunit Na+/H+ antiporter MnhC subunit
VALLALAVSLAPGEWPAQAYAHQAARPAAQVSTAPLTLSPTFLPSGQVGKPYLQAITASGETGPYTFGVTIGTIPPGLGLSADGVLSGTPTTVDSYGFLVMVTDADGNTVSQGYSLNIVSPIAVSPPVLPEGAAALEPPYADPVPQALVLTAIVIGFGLLAFSLVLAHRVHDAVGSDDVDDMGHVR